MNTPQPRALLVDFYGTLAHGPGFRFTESALIMVESLRCDGLDLDAEEFRATYRQAVRPYLEIMRSGRETHNTSWLADTLTALGQPCGPDDPRVARAVRAYFEAYAEAIVPIAGADDALKRLAAIYPVVLVSNFTDPFPVRAALARFGWERLLHAVLISADLGIRKPHPDMFRAALDAAGCAPSEALFVGDDLEEDIAGAQAADIPTVHVSRPDPSFLRALTPRNPEVEIHPDWSIERFADLPGLLDGASP